MRRLPLILLLTTGCDLFGTVRAGGKPVNEAYGGAHELRVLDVEAPLRPERKIPVLSTPEVMAVFVPSHAAGEMLVGDHWLYLRLRESRWYPERLVDPDPPATGTAAPESMKPLKDLDWRKVVVPHRNGGQ